MSSEPGAQHSATLAILSEAFPALFSLDKAQPLPIGITGELLARGVPGLSEPALSAFMGWWTARPAYLARIVEGGLRIGLDGEPRGKVEGWQQADARKRLGLSRKPLALPQVGRALPEHRRARAIRDGNPPGTDLAGEEFAFVAGLLALHPDATARTRDMVGLRVIEYLPGQNAFAVVRADGSVEDFSVRKCLANRPGKDAASGGGPAAAR